MRTRVQAEGLTVQVVAGNHAVFFGFDLSDQARTDCLGFALHRQDHTEGEQYWMVGFKTFRSVVPQPSTTSTYTTDKHPIQSMWWGDYTAKPAHRYTYRVVPMYGSPKNLSPRAGVSATVEVTTNDPGSGTHGVYFNRGVAASQAYAAKFGIPPHDLPTDKQQAAMAWLSRGLQEALCSFITADVSPALGLRAAVYEFTEPTVLAAFAQAHAAGADVRIVYHAKGDQGSANDAAIDAAGLDRSILIPRQHPQIAHNKFIVRAHREADGDLSGTQVWTGSTNLSQGGIFGHSNVGHIVRDAQVAETFLCYWAALATDPTHAPLQAWVSGNNPIDEVSLDTIGVHALFSPRTEMAPLDWYAQGFAAAASSTHITLPFGMDNTHFEPLLASAPADGSLRYVLLDRKDDHQDTWGASPSVLVAVGAQGGPDSLTRWAHETLTGVRWLPQSVPSGPMAASGPFGHGARPARRRGGPGMTCTPATAWVGRRPTPWLVVDVPGMEAGQFVGSGGSALPRCGCHPHHPKRTPAVGGSMTTVEPLDVATARRAATRALVNHALLVLALLAMVFLPLLAFPVLLVPIVALRVMRGPAVHEWEAAEQPGLRERKLGVNSAGYLRFWAERAGWPASKLLVLRQVLHYGATAAFLALAIVIWRSY